MRTACPVGSTAAVRPGGLEHAELRLQLGGVAAERVEGLADARSGRGRPRPAGMSSKRGRERQRRDPCAAWTFDSHLVVASLSTASTRRRALVKYDFFIGWSVACA